MSEENDPTQPPVRQPPVPTETGPGPVPYYKFADAWQKLQDARSRIAELEGEARSAGEHEARANRAESEIARLKDQHVIDLQLVKIGGPFAHSSVQRMVRREYDAYRKEAGEGAATFAAWLENQREDPLFRPYFQALEPKTEPEKQVADPTDAPPAPATAVPPPITPPPTDPNAGADPDAPPVPGAPGFNEEALGRLAKDPVAWKRHREAIRKNLEQSLGHTLGAGFMFRSGQNT